MWPFRDRRPAWQRAEAMAARYLRRRGYRILHRNLRLDRFELDIVAQKRDTVVFVEVRSRTDENISAPEETVRYTKRQHLRAAARRYVARFGKPNLYYRFDVMGVVMEANKRVRIKHYENAFTLDE